MPGSESANTATVPTANNINISQGSAACSRAVTAPASRLNGKVPTHEAKTYHTRSKDKAKKANKRSAPETSVSNVDGKESKKTKRL